MVANPSEGGRHCALRSTRQPPELLGNVAQKLRGALFCFRRNFLLHKTLHAREFFVHSPAKIFEVLDAFEPRKLFVDALAELFEFIHKRQISAKITVQRRSAATWVL